jgi:hypothetical protein
MARKYKATIETPDGPRTGFQLTVQGDRGRKPLVARFGGIPLTRQRTAVIADVQPTMATVRGNELIHRLLAGQCELCEQRTGCKSTTSANSPTSTSQDGRNGPRGCA